MAAAEDCWPLGQLVTNISLPGLQSGSQDFESYFLSGKISVLKLARAASVDISVYNFI